MANIKKYWPIQRTLLFIIIGVVNTILIRPEDVGTWKNYLGYLFLFVAVIDAIQLVRQYLNKKKV